MQIISSLHKNYFRIFEKSQVSNNQMKYNYIENKIEKND